MSESMRSRDTAPSGSTPDPYPFSTVEDLSQFFLWPLLDRRQQSDTLSIAGRAERHQWFAACLSTNGYRMGPAEQIATPDLIVEIATYLASLDDAQEFRDAGRRTRREAALSELVAFPRWTLQREARQNGATP